MPESLQTITLGGGCFWCTDAVFSRLKGVNDVTCGYCNGHVKQPSYEQVCTGNTGHNEVVQVTFDASQISLKQLFGVFFGTHDPTTLNQQGNDIGTQYRSGVYYQSPEQQQVALDFMAELAREQVFKKPLVTEVVPLDNYWPAEGYHQDYFEQHPNTGYCAFVVEPKVAKLRKSFAQWLKPAQ
jgi:peptide-methionine (S)-S-oxide reductase